MNFSIVDFKERSWGHEKVYRATCLSGRFEEVVNCQ